MLLGSDRSTNFSTTQQFNLVFYSFRLNGFRIVFSILKCVFRIVLFQQKPLNKTSNQVEDVGFQIHRAQD